MIKLTGVTAKGRITDIWVASDGIGVLDSTQDNIVGQSILITKFGLQFPVKGGVNEVAAEINQQLEGM